MAPRLDLALNGGGLVLPGDGAVAVFRPRVGHDLSPLPQGRVQVIQPFAPDFHHFETLGYSCQPEVARTADQAGPNARFAAAIVFLPRAKALARALVAQAAARTDGPVVVDGAKTDGIDSLLRDLRKRTEIHGPIAKAHGKLFWFDAPGPDLGDWAARPTRAGDFVTVPGVFSALEVDPASRLLADTLPERIGAHVADLGAGWGYLAARLLERGSIETLHLVEADHDALACARQNVTDPRARFHWYDARIWTAPEALDAVVMNPPFHEGRSAEPDLGRAFIAAAARLLSPSGRLWMVANRHLPYETALRDAFAEVREIGGNNRFKMLLAARPSRARRK